MSEETELLELNNEDVKEYIELLGKVTRSFMQGKKTMKEGELRKLLKEFGNHFIHTNGRLDTCIESFIKQKQNSFTIKADKDSSNISEDWQWHNEGDEQQNKKGLTEQSKPYGIGANRPHTEQQSEKDSSGVSEEFKGDVLAALGELFEKQKTVPKHLRYLSVDNYDEWMEYFYGKKHREAVEQQKQKDWQPLFKTEDGKDVYKNDAWMVYKVTPDFDILMFAACDAGFHSDSKYFANEELAKDYVLMNKPCLSLNEIERIMSMNIVKGCTHKNERHIHGTATINSLKQIVQQKIN